MRSRSLSTCAGIRVLTVSGSVKGAKSDSAGPGNTWLAVWVNQQWRFIDAHWGSEVLDGYQDDRYILIDDNGNPMRKSMQANAGEKQFCHDESWFLTDPEEMIYSHFPDDETHQLLARPVTRREFGEMVRLRHPFFDLGLTLESHPKGTIYSSHGDVEIEIGTPEGSGVKFMYQLWLAAKDKEEVDLDGVELTRYVFLVQPEDILQCKITFPVVGTYKFVLFAATADSNEYKEACTYKIFCEKAMKCKPIPKNNRPVWGPGNDLTRQGIVPISHKDAIIEAEGGTAELRFRVKEGVEVLHDLHSNELTKGKLKNYVVHMIDDNELAVRVKIPEAGDYALNLFAKGLHDDSQTFPNVCSYLIRSDDKADDPAEFPLITNGRVGASKENQETGLIPLSHKCPIIDVGEEGEVAITFQNPAAVTTVHCLELFSKNKLTEQENSVLRQSNGDKLTFEIRFQMKGTYRFEVYAKNANDSEANSSHSHAYTYVINVASGMPSWSPFPQQFSPNCKLHEPKSGILSNNQNVRFAATIPNAFDVAVIGPNGWTHLQCDDVGVWSGQINTGEAENQLRLSAQLEQGVNSYTAVMDYQVGTFRAFCNFSITVVCLQNILEIY